MFLVILFFRKLLLIWLKQKKKEEIWGRYNMIDVLLQGDVFHFDSIIAKILYPDCTGSFDKENYKVPFFVNLISSANNRKYNSTIFPLNAKGPFLQRKHFAKIPNCANPTLWPFQLGPNKKVSKIKKKPK